MNSFKQFVQSSKATYIFRRQPILLVLLWMVLFVPAAFGQTIIFREDWSNGIGNWSVSNGVWEVGTPVPGVGPDTCYSPTKCAGTLIGANYPNGSNTRLESPIAPAILLPRLNGEKIQLKFWHWFRNSDDNGFVQISVNNGRWKTIPNPGFTGFSAVWTQYVADLSAYADSTIRLGFLFTSDNSGTDHGWYIDDIRIEKAKVIFGTYAKNLSSTDSVVVENFEKGVDSWSANNGLWEVGTPKSVGPPNCFSPPNCAGTVLSGSYPNSKQTRFVSPAITLKPKLGEVPVLFFWHWFGLLDDNGFVEISVNNGPWRKIHTAPFTGVSQRWTQAGGFNLSAYADSTIRIGFIFTSDNSGTDHGWYIDDIRISGIKNPTSVKTLTPQSFDFTLHQNYPNPFNPSTSIIYDLPRAGEVEITIFNLLGEQIRRLVNQRQAAGQYRIQWDGRNENGKSMPSGVYLYRLRAGEFVQTRRMILMQ